MEKVYPNFSYERLAIKQGYRVVAGLDEVGRGAWAGPVVASAVIIPSEFILKRLKKKHVLREVRDSKLLNKKRRQEIGEWLKNETVWAVGECTSSEIDELGIGQATKRSMLRALSRLSLMPNFLLIDGQEVIETKIGQQSITRGDNLSISIAAASIIAKTHRDQIMSELSNQYPNYGFGTHVGYGTRLHIEAISQYGPCSIHRYSYRPIAAFGQT